MLREAFEDGELPLSPKAAAAEAAAEAAETKAEQAAEAAAEAAAAAAAAAAGVADKGLDTGAEEEDDDDEEGPPPELLVCRGCSVLTALNGRYERTAAFDAFAPSMAGRPSYRLAGAAGDAGGTAGGAAGGAGGAPLLCFWWRFGGSSVQQGWWVGPAFGAKDGLVAHCPSAARRPPRGGWQVKADASKRRVPDKEAGFLLPAEAEAEATVAAAAEVGASAATEAAAAAAAAAEASASAAAAAVAVRGESEARVRALDLGRLMGRVRGAGATTGRRHAEAYFGHFCTAIHLEFLQARMYTDTLGASFIVVL